MISPTFQIDPHTAIAVNAVVAVVYFFNLPLNFCFLGTVIRLPVFSVVIVGIRTDSQPAQQPPNAEFFMMLVDKSVSL